MTHHVETMAYVGEVPWHGLGTKARDDLTSVEFAKEAGLDWGVYQVPAYAELQGEQVDVDRSILVRDTDHKILTVTSSEWKPCQNSDAFSFFDDFMKVGNMKLHTAGSLKGGNYVWVLAQVQESFELFGSDRVDSFLLFTNPHVFGRAIDIRFTPIRAVCWNTLSLALAGQEDNVYKSSHRNAFDPQMAKDYLGIASDKMLAYKEKAEYLGSKRFTKESLLTYYKTIFPNMTKNPEFKNKLSKNAGLALNFHDTQPGAQYAEGTWWQAANTITWMADHVLSKTVDTRMYNAWYGTTKNLKIEALNKAVEMAQVS